MKKEIPYGMYDIDNKYLDYLRVTDKRVPKSDYEKEGFNRKFYCGPVYVSDGIPFFVPISHQVRTKEHPMHKYALNIKNEQTNTLVGTLDFRFMVPCLPDHTAVHKLDPNRLKNDSSYAQQVALAQICFDKKTIANIKAKAKETYIDVISDFEVARYSTKLDENIEHLWDYEDHIDELKEKNEYQPDPFIETMRKVQSTAEKNTPAQTQQPPQTQQKLPAVATAPEIDVPVETPEESTLNQDTPK